MDSKEKVRDLFKEYCKQDTKTIMNIDWGSLEKTVFLRFMYGAGLCVCEHDTMMHSINKTGDACCAKDCNCKGFATDNLRWLVKQ